MDPRVKPAGDDGESYKRRVKFAGNCFSTANLKFASNTSVALAVAGHAGNGLRDCGYGSTTQQLQIFSPEFGGEAGRFAFPHNARVFEDVDAIGVRQREGHILLA
jgi:hypothetical protein